MFFENNLSGQNFVLHKKICWHAMFLSQMLLTGMVKHNTLLNILRKHSCQLVKVEKSCTIAAAKFSFRFAMWRRIICWRSKKCWSVHFLLHYITLHVHLADAFIQSNLQCIQAIHVFFYQYVCSLGIEPTTFCAANAMLYHWATGTHVLHDLHCLSFQQKYFDL